MGGQGKGALGCGAVPGWVRLQAGDEEQAGPPPQSSLPSHRPLPQGVTWCPSLRRQGVKNDSSFPETLETTVELAEAGKVEVLGGLGERMEEEGTAATYVSLPTRQNFDKMHGRALEGACGCKINQRRSKFCSQSPVTR